MQRQKTSQDFIDFYHTEKGLYFVNSQPRWNWRRWGKRLSLYVIKANINFREKKPTQTLPCLLYCLSRINFQWLDKKAQMGSWTWTDEKKLGLEFRLERSNSTIESTKVKYHVWICFQQNFAPFVSVDMWEWISCLFLASTPTEQRQF